MVTMSPTFMVIAILNSLLSTARPDMGPRHSSPMLGKIYKIHQEEKHVEIEWTIAEDLSHITSEGKPRTVKVLRTLNQQIRFADWQVRNASGMILSEKNMWQQLKPGQIIVISHGLPIGTDYMQLLAKDALIFECRWPNSR